MMSKTIRFGALSAAREPIPGCPVCDISMKMESVPRFGDKALLWRRRQGRHRHYNSIRDPKQGSRTRIQNETTKQEPSMPTIQAGITVYKRVPEVGTAGPLLAGTAAGGFVTRCSCGCGTKVGTAVTKATCHQM